MDNRYPIGQFAWTGFHYARTTHPRNRRHRRGPAKMRGAVAGLTNAQLDTPYREGGWTVRQVVHHVPDSHMNSYIRFKFALTEHEPTIKPYDEAVWANLIDAKTAPVDPSLELLEGLHHRWAMLLRSLADDEVKRKFNHPELGTVTIDQYIALYAWQASTTSRTSRRCASARAGKFRANHAKPGTNCRRSLKHLPLAQ